MQIQAYQFIKYDNQTSIEHIEKVNNTGAVLCFDFEDGIINPLNNDVCSKVKEAAREQFNRLYSIIHDAGILTKIGIRLNNCYTADFEKDLVAIRGKTFDSILLPKIERPEDIHLIIEMLNAYAVGYKDIMPIVESKIGFENLESILQSNQKFCKIAFGHCDYNLNIGAYPFFHQDSWEYWKWIAVFISKIEKYGVSLISSPYLNLKDEGFFCAMLDYIASKSKHFNGQFTLTIRQSELCQSRITTTENFKNHLENKNMISADIKIALDLVEEFKRHNKSKGLTKTNSRFISLQEYIASLNLANDDRLINEMCFVGGCFPVQHNIVFEDLFHQKLKRKLENKFNTRLNVNIIRYELFSTLIGKIETLAKQKQLNLIVFHVRPEPYLRRIKLLYKYIDDQGKLKWSFNLPSFNLLKSEKFDMLISRRIFDFNIKQRQSLFHSFLISCNYILGRLIRNEHYALKSYWAIIDNVIDFCEKNKIKLIILGPNRRNNNCLEPSLCKDLDLYISKRLKNQHYICGYERGINSTKMNQENGIHVTQAYHDLISEKLYNKIVHEKLLSLLN